MYKVFESVSEEQLQDIVTYLSSVIKKGTVIALEGDLGAGKTTFARAIITKLTGLQKVISPTFNLVQIYEGNGNKIWHYDLYRVKHTQELEELAIEEALEDIVIMEWYHKAKPYLPDQLMCITISFTDNQNTRNFTVELVENDVSV